MRIFLCVCGNRIHFENTSCLVCGRALGFLPDLLTMSAVEPADGGEWRAVDAPAANDRWRKCANYADEHVCNWMVPAGSAETFCAACRLNRTIPNLSKPENRLLWARIEAAKRRLVYDLLSHGLPFASKADDPHSGLAFRFLEDQPGGAEFSESASDGRVMTGHANGVITINIAEADDVAREQMRVQMNEAYRTLLGHFRHESGHYFWDRLVRDDPALLDGFRAVFGDERADYASSLERHYAAGPPPDWAEHHISAYASSHPWEDWGETWAHYLQMADALETADAVGLGRGAGGGDFDGMLAAWVPLTVAINSINRSLGVGDAYPFALAPAMVAKLRFVHEVVRGPKP
jgi:hypothetical protein